MNWPKKIHEKTPGKLHWRQTYTKEKLDIDLKDLPKHYDLFLNVIEPLLLNDLHDAFAMAKGNPRMASIKEELMYRNTCYPNNCKRISMRTLIFLILIFLSINISTAQDSHASNRYEIVLENFAPGTYSDGFFVNIFPEEGDTAFIRLLDTVNRDEIIKLQLSHNDVDLYNSSTVETIRNVPFSNIKEAVRLEVEYLACCSSEYNYYFLLTTKNEYIPLPVFKDVHCDGPEPFLAYKFSNPNESTDGVIELLRYFPNRTYEIDSTKLIESYTFRNGKIHKYDSSMRR